MDVQGVLRWLVEAKIPVGKAMPLVGSLAAAGVKDSGGIATLNDEALALAVTDKLFLKKIRAKISGPSTVGKGKKRSGGEASADGGKGGCGGSGSGSGSGKRARPSSEDKTVDAAAERAPAPPECSLSETDLAAIEVKINRSPVMVLWATEVAQRLSFDWSESVTIGRVMADWLAMRKGEYLGVMDADEAAERAAKEKTDDLPTRTVEIMGQDFTLRQTKGGWRAISKGKIVPAKRVHAYLCKAFGEDLGPVRAALRALATAIPQHQVDTTIRAMVLYESFRPDVAKGKAGWGQSGTLRLARVMQLRDELAKEVDGQGAAA